MSTQALTLSPGFELVRPRALSHARREITKQDLDRLLAWLHPGREEAGRAYEQIRRKLITVFASRGCDCPEELTDETMDRVIGKVERIAGSYEGDPALYFYGVARNVWREYLKVRRMPTTPPPDPPDSLRPELDCLDECMEKLLPKNRELLVEYYHEDKQAKIDHRKELAGRHGLDMNALRIRVHRIRSVVGECTTTCLNRRSIH
jgi:DNA-directed RNA polymerase specialized sigma24 family protein